LVGVGVFNLNYLQRKVYGIAIAMQAMMIDKDNCVLVVVDIQEKLAPYISGIEEILKNAKKLIKACRIFELPVIVTEQKKLGNTVEDLRDVLGKFEPIQKMAFSCVREEKFVEELEKTGRKTCILMGIEAHICIAQTVMDLMEMGYDVHVIVDAIGSRKELDKEIAIQRMIVEGAIPTTTEMVMYELLKSAEAEEFKDILKLVKE
jgi:nicotinamidase-related amidase